MYIPKHLDHLFRPSWPVCGDVNQQFIYEFKRYIPRPEMAELYKIILKEAWNNQATHLQDERKQLLKLFKELEDKLSYIRDLLSSKQIEPEDFREMKSDYSAKIEKLEAKLTACNNDNVNIKGLLDIGIDNLLKLDNIYENADIEKKREVISSMYPEKLTFDGFLLRTPRINEAVQLIYSMDKGLIENKNKISGNNSNLSCEVGRTGQGSNRFLVDLQTIIFRQRKNTVELRCLHILLSYYIYITSRQSHKLRYYPIEWLSSGTSSKIFVLCISLFYS